MSITTLELVLFASAVLAVIGYKLALSGRRRGRDTALAPLECPDPNCRHLNPAEAVFCGKCGRRLDSKPA